MSPAEDPKARFLASHGALHPHPERVRAPLFQGSDFFDPRDLVQVRYEMLRRHLVDGQAVAGVARATANLPAHSLVENDCRSSSPMLCIKVT